MTTMDHNLSTPLDIIVLIIFGMVSITGLLGNGFIIVLNSHRWLQGRKLVPRDCLLTCLSISSFLMQCATLSSQYIYISSPMDHMCNYAWKGCGLVWMYFTMANFSGTNCLTAFYCMKVTTFAHPVILWLKSTNDWLVPRMLAMSFIAIDFFYFLPAVGFWSLKTSCRLRRNLTANTSQTEASDEFLYLIKNHPQLSFSAINFSICLTASIGTKDTSTQAHIKVIKQLMFILFVYVLYFVVIIIALGEILKYGNAEQLISDMALSLYPSAHLVILIWTYPKLKGECARILATLGKPLPDK